MTRRRILAALVAVAALGVPAPAMAAERFVGILENGWLVQFQSDAPTGLSTPRIVRGLVPREQLVALAATRGRLYGIGSSARLYGIDYKSARAFRIGAPFTEGLRGRRFSLAVTADGTQARVLSDVGQHLGLDLATGATTDLGPLRRDSDRSQVFPAADLASDGRLVGVDVARREILTETAPGSAVMSSRPLNLERFADLVEPVTFDIAAGGRPWLLASFGGSVFRRQSIARSLDLTTGKPAGRFRPHLRRVVTFAAVGRTADDTRPARIRVLLPRGGRLSVSGMLSGRLPIRVLADEGGQAVAWVKIRRNSSGPGLETRDTAGTYRIRNFRLMGEARERARQLVGRRVRVRVEFSDWAGNRTSWARWVRLRR